MGDTASWWYKTRLPELEREKEEKERLEKASTFNEDNFTEEGVVYSKHDWEYNTDDCTHIVNINIPDDILIKLTKEAHKRDITLNHLMNEILHDSIQRNIL